MTFSSVGPQGGASSTVGGSTLPASPTPRQIFMKTSGGSEGLYICFSAGSWLLVEANTGAGTVTSVSVTTNAGVSGSVANATTTPAITLTLGAITPSSVTTGVITQTSASATAFESGPNGSTNPVLRIVNSTASQADGISITGGAAGAGTTIAALSSGANSGFTFTPKGTGTGGGAVTISGVANAQNALTLKTSSLTANLNLDHTTTNIGLNLGTLTNHAVSIATNNGTKFVFDTTGNFRLASTGSVGFNSGDYSTAEDARISRSSAGVLSLDTTTSGNGLGSLLAANSTFSGTISNTSPTANTGGGYTRSFTEATVTLSGASGSIAVNIPVGAKLLGVQLRVDTLITSGDGGATWAAAYAGGSTQAITTGQAFAKNTKVNTMFDSFAATPIVVGSVATITITPNAGTFSAGVVRAVVYFEDFTALSNNP